MRLREDDADLLAREDEVFRASALDRAHLLRAAFRHGGDRAAYDEAAHRFELKGTRPTGAFGDAERKLHLEILESWRTTLSEVLGDAEELNLCARTPKVLTLSDKRIELYESSRSSCSRITALRSSTSFRTPMSCSGVSSANSSSKAVRATR